MRKVLALLLTVLLIGSLATAVFAEDDPSKTANPEYEIDIIYEFKVPEYGDTTIVKEDEEYILKPRDKDGYIFDHYEIEGTYEIISKDGNTWTIVAHSSLTIHVMYKGVTPKPNPQDNKPVSPSTGVNTVLYSVMILLGLFGIAFATRKLVKTH